MRPTAADPRRPPDRRRHSRRGTPADRHRRPRQGVPPADPGHQPPGRQRSGRRTPPHHPGVLMSPRITLRTAGRILRQLSHDKRTIGLLLVAPLVLMTLLRYLFDAHPRSFDRIGLIMLGVFPFVIMFLVTSVAMLRERTTGTLERLLPTPLAKLDLLLGYGLAFALA